ncbi:MAG TPA: lysylphosphatidylglycerol synthase domain-containing protein [Stellaceae bacterium]|nr:lysylphosphatidylglycerol synthase domain-containing protein [Stellaceae bacterium]
MRLSTFIAWLLGVGLLAALVAVNDPAQVLRAVARLRYWLLLAIVFHAVPLWLDVVAWQRLFSAPPRMLALMRIRWIAEGVNGLLPVPHLGELLRADLTRRISRAGEAGASVVVDVTLGVATQVLFAALGIAFFALLTGGSPLLRGLVLATAILSVGGATFYLLQRAGLFALAAHVVRRWSSEARRRFDMDDARALDGRVRTLYARRAELFSAALWRFAGWVAGAGEIWLLLYGLGHPIGLAQAIMLESLSQAARTAAFAIPGGLGIQDGALLVLCQQLGLGAETGLALALAKRCRELVLGVPALLAGYVIQARRVAARAAWPDAPPPA